MPRNNNEGCFGGLKAKMDAKKHEREVKKEHKERRGSRSSSSRSSSSGKRRARNYDGARVNAVTNPHHHELAGQGGYYPGTVVDNGINRPTHVGYMQPDPNVQRHNGYHH